MSALSIQPTYPIFTDIDGQPLENGYVWIGTANLNPQTNPINVYWDAALTISATQPIRTLGGYPSRSGTPARLYVNSDYSILVQNRNGSAVYSAQSATERYSDVVISDVTVDANNVTYTAPGTGAVATTGQDKFEQYVADSDYSDIAEAIAEAGTNEVVHIVGTPSQTSSTAWNGRQHHTDEAPFNLNNITWTGANLNARMCVNNGMLYCCEYVNNTVAVFSLADMRDPSYLGSIAVGSQPRHVEVIGRYMFVCCHGAASIQVHDISSPTQFSATIVGTITTGANPKMFQILGNEIYVACFGANTVEKHIFTLPPSGITGFSSTKLGEVSVSSGPLCLALNGDGLLAVCGLNTANVQIIGTSTLNLLSTSSVGGAGHATCSFVNKVQLLVTDSTNDRLYSCNCSSLAAVVTGYADTSPNPEQIEIVGNRCYVPSLTDPGQAAFLDCFDITDAVLPIKYKSVPLTVTGAGFTAYTTDGQTGYVYVNGHFTPYNIDVIEVPSGPSGRMPMNAVENFEARTAGFSNLSASVSNIGVQTQTFEYRTSTSNTTATAQDMVIRLGLGANLALPDPALMNGKLLIIKNVHNSLSSNVTNAFTGYSGTLTPGQAVMLVSMSFASSWQWDAIASF